MGRGIDFKGVNLVLNYDFPPTAVSYIHRIGNVYQPSLSGVLSAHHQKLGGGGGGGGGDPHTILAHSQTLKLEDKDELWTVLSF